jgi:hypothetical protein
LEWRLPTTTALCCTASAQGELVYRPSIRTLSSALLCCSAPQPVHPLLLFLTTRPRQPPQHPHQHLLRLDVPTHSHAVFTVRKPRALDWWQFSFGSATDGGERAQFSFFLVSFFLFTRQHLEPSLNVVAADAMVMRRTLVARCL